MTLRQAQGEREIPTAYTGPFPIRGLTLEQVDRHARALRTPRARSAKPCYLCGQSGQLGCDHFAPWEPDQ